MIEVKIIEDSITSDKARLSTFVLRYPRYIHSEFMTHRMISKNASSSRAIDSKILLKQIIDNPVIPTHWGREQRGMQAWKELNGVQKLAAEHVWKLSRFPAVGAAALLNKIGLHKQMSNRIIEPWSHISVICTATEWDNFYTLRCDKHAHPDIRELALKMLDAHNSSIPEVRIDTWHLPFVTAKERKEYGPQTALKCSVARCARVSYLNHDKTKPSVDKDVKLHDMLLKNKHMSPFEHQALPSEGNSFIGNFKGWRQYRKSLPNECFLNYGDFIK